MIKLDLTELTPLERAALERQAALASEAEGRAVSVEEFAAAFVARHLEGMTESYITEALPTMRPLAARFLNLTGEGQAEVMTRLGELEASAAA